MYNMSKPELNIDFFINKFKQIPDVLWTTGKLIDRNHYNNVENDFPKCALGHCFSEYKMSLLEKNDENSIGLSFLVNNEFEISELSRIFEENLIFFTTTMGETNMNWYDCNNGIVYEKGFRMIPTINDGHHTKYRQVSPKDRIITALTDLKQHLESIRESELKLNLKPEVIVKEKTVYVAVAVTLTEQSKKLMEVSN